MLLVILDLKGAWLCYILTKAGAEVTGYSLAPDSEPNLFDVSKVDDLVDSKIGDIRDLEELERVFNQANPEIVIHMAAQPLVRESYVDPRYTYDTNVMGTVNILECVRKSQSVKSFLNVTTDKVYLNNEWVWGYRETDQLNGYDPYSNSKSCSELVTHSYKNSFFKDSKVSISTVRAGNVIGGGDFAKDRILPDCIRAAGESKSIEVRNPHSVRPYQHVLEPLFAYLMILKMQYDNLSYAGCYNVGPEEVDCISTGTLVDLFCNKWKEVSDHDQNWINQHDGGPHEANLLKLDCSKIKSVFGWRTTWNVETAVSKTVEWANGFYNQENISDIMNRQIDEFMYDRNFKV